MSQSAFLTVVVVGVFEHLLCRLTFSNVDWYLLTLLEGIKEKKKIYTCCFEWDPLNARSQSRIVKLLNKDANTAITFSLTLVWRLYFGCSTSVCGSGGPAAFLGFIQHCPSILY